MNPVFERLNKESGNTIELFKDDKTWAFTDKLSGLGQDFYLKMYQQVPILTLEYTIQCQALYTSMSSGGKINSEKLIDDLKTALMLAELQEYLYSYYLDVPREVTRLRKEQREFRKALKVYGYTFSNTKLDDELDSETHSPTQTIRRLTREGNWYRLFGSRSVRLLTVIELFTSHIGNYTKFIMGLNVVTSHILPYLAFIYFIPRLLTNLGIILKHTFLLGLKEGDKSHTIPQMTILWTQIKRRWTELANDIPWVGVGTVNAFVMIGMLAPFASYVSLAFFIYDVLLASVRLYIELNQLKELKRNCPNFDADENKIFREEYEKLYDFVSKQLKVSLALFVAIAIAGLCAIPVFIACPAIPLAGAILVVSVSIAAFFINKYSRNFEPKTCFVTDSFVTSSISNNKFGFFQQPAISSDSQQNTSQYTIPNFGGGGQ